jgi:hypothetical protein
MPDISDDCARFMAQLSPGAAADGNLTDLFLDDTPYPEVALERKAHAACIAVCVCAECRCAGRRWRVCWLSCRRT